MRGNELLDKLELVDPAYVEAADGRKRPVWLRWGAMAACLCVAAAAFFAIKARTPPVEENPVTETKQPSVQTSPVSEAEQPPVEAAPPVEPNEPEEGCVFHYNTAWSMLDAARKYVPGYFTQVLDDRELAALAPDMTMPDMTFSGLAGFDGSGSLQNVTLQVEAPFLSGAAASVHFSYVALPNGYALEAEPEISRLFGREFTVYEWKPEEKSVYYDAFGAINGCYMQISYASHLSAEQARSDFQTLAECFAAYSDGKPDLSILQADEIPEWFDRQLTFSEAQADEVFGPLMPDAIPDGFAEESLRRYKDQNHDYLSGLWTRGHDELNWQISFYTEQDAERLTGVEQRENYDLSLYPIPRADSVPEKLRQMVNDPIFLAEELTLDAVYARAYHSGETGDSSGWRMNFTVRYGNYLVSIRAKGVEPEWVFEQLQGRIFS